jgi:DNA invertase Pin-like site-specific DNA recombinase
MRTINYYRVSTTKQGRSGLGEAAQRAAVEAFCASRGCEPLYEYVEVESGKKNDRPELAKALHHAKVTGATLVIAKLDRLSRNVAFLAALQDAGTKFVAADMPEANELTLHIMAAMAQAERKAISKRTKEALAAAKARAEAEGIGYKADGTPWKNGSRLGNPMGAKAFGTYKGNGAAVEAIKAKAKAFAADVMPIIEAVRAEGHQSLRAIAAELNSRGIVTARGGKWAAQSVSDVIALAGAGLPAQDS